MLPIAKEAVMALRELRLAINELRLMIRELADREKV